MSATDVAVNEQATAEQATRAVQDPLALRVQKNQEALYAKLAKKDSEIADLKKQLQQAKSSNTRVHKIPKPRKKTEEAA